MNNQSSNVPVNESPSSRSGHEQRRWPACEPCLGAGAAVATGSVCGLSLVPLALLVLLVLRLRRVGAGRGPSGLLISLGLYFHVNRSLLTLTHTLGLLALPHFSLPVPPYLVSEASRSQGLETHERQDQHAPQHHHPRRRRQPACLLRHDV
jgi:hypothetical protein